MNMQSFTGSSIQSALRTARRELGDEIVLMESQAPKNGAPARVTVMVDAAAAPAPARREQRAPFGYQANQQYAADEGLTEESARVVRENVSSFADRLQAFVAEEAAPTAVAQYRPQNGGSGGRRGGRGSIFPASGGAQATDTGQAERTEKLLEAQMERLHERLDRMERRFSDSIVGAGQEWVTHPLFSLLLDQGLRPGTARRLFDGLAARGFDTQTDEEHLRWALAQEMRRLLDRPAPKTCTGNALFIGPGGSGKTSLLLKLARHASFFGRRSVSVITITPEDESIPYHDPTDLYRRFELPVQCVSDADEMAQALRRAERFDHVLIDTPPLPLNVAAAQRMLKRIAKLTGSLMPLQAHLVVSAARALDSFETDFLRRLPIRPDTLALTHLDETRGWGRVAEWLMTMNEPVQFVGTGPRVPDDLASFSPTWFVEEMMDL